MEPLCAAQACFGGTGPSKAGSKIDLSATQLVLIAPNIDHVLAAGLNPLPAIRKLCLMTELDAPDFSSSLTSWSRLVALDLNRAAFITDSNVHAVAANLARCLTQLQSLTLCRVGASSNVLLDALDTLLCRPKAPLKTLVVRGFAVQPPRSPSATLPDPNPDALGRKRGLTRLVLDQQFHSVHSSLISPATLLHPSFAASLTSLSLSGISLRLATTSSSSSFAPWTTSGISPRFYLPHLVALRFDDRCRGPASTLDSHLAGATASAWLAGLPECPRLQCLVVDHLQGPTGRAVRITDLLARYPTLTHACLASTFLPIAQVNRLSRALFPPSGTTAPTKFQRLLLRNVASGLDGWLVGGTAMVPPRGSHQRAGSASSSSSNSRVGGARTPSIGPRCHHPSSPSSAPMSMSPTRAAGANDASSSPTTPSPRNASSPMTPSPRVVSAPPLRDPLAFDDDPPFPPRGRAPSRTSSSSSSSNGGGGDVPEYALRLINDLDKGFQLSEWMLEQFGL
ncbi:hypothetical protein H9P43_000598 [Blastocladiella emersonii ATCC 22665]|nr:hypothetical protein H9P43_000598 [Blastocladiella emersonii ATCC 22665]